MVKKYTWIRVEKEAKNALDERLKRINNIDLKNMGLKDKKINQIDLTKFLFKQRIFISDKELKNLAKKKFGERLC